VCVCVCGCVGVCVCVCARARARARRGVLVRVCATHLILNAQAQNVLHLALDVR